MVTNVTLKRINNKYLKVHSLYRSNREPNLTNKQKLYNVWSSRYKLYFLLHNINKMSASELIVRNSLRKSLLHSILDNQLLDQDNLISKPLLSENSSFRENSLEYEYSFGYDCKKLYNLCLIDENILVFGSGTLIHFFNITSGQVWVRRTAKGTGIGFITVSNFSLALTCT